MSNITPDPLHGDRRDDREKRTCDFYCRIHGWITVEWSNPALKFTKGHNQKTGCTPVIETVSEAVVRLIALAAENEDVAVFWDRGWGDAPLEISIIVDGNGQNPRAIITEGVYWELLSSKRIGDNCLLTYKARKVHDFVVPEAAMPS